MRCDYAARCAAGVGMLPHDGIVARAGFVARKASLATPWWRAVVMRDNVAAASRRYRATTEDSVSAATYPARVLYLLSMVRLDAKD